MYIIHIITITILPQMASLCRKGDGMVGNPHRAQICQFELFELVLLLKPDKEFLVERFEATVSQSAVPSPPLNRDNYNLHIKNINFNFKQQQLITSPNWQSMLFVTQSRLL